MFYWVSYKFLTKNLPEEERKLRTFLYGTVAYGLLYYIMETKWFKDISIFDIIRQNFWWALTADGLSIAYILKDGDAKKKISRKIRSNLDLSSFNSTDQPPEWLQSANQGFQGMTRGLNMMNNMQHNPIQTMLNMTDDEESEIEVYKPHSKKYRKKSSIISSGEETDNQIISAIESGNKKRKGRNHKQRKRQ